LTLLGISLGLATLVATRLTVHTAHLAYGELFEDAAGGTALEVTSPGQGGFDGRFAPGLASVPGVRSVIPRVQGAAALVGPTGTVSVPVQGVEPESAAAVAGWSLCDGHVLAGADEMLLDSDLARGVGLQPGDTARLWAPGGPAELRLVGLLRPRGSGAALGGVLVVHLATAQRLFALGDRVNSVQLLLASGADPARVQAEARRLVPSGLTVQLPGSRGELARATLQATELGLDGLSLMALVGAAFIILNTFLLNVGERRRQLAILRALGATRTQVRRLLVREMLLLGVAGTLAGCAGGLLLAQVLLHLMGRIVGVPLPGLHLTAEPFVLAAVAGPCLAIVAAWVPAWCASRRQPLEELLPPRSRPGHRLPRWVCLAGLWALAAGAVLEVALCRGWLPAGISRLLLGPALALLLVGCILALPLLAGLLLRLAATIPLGLKAALAQQQLRRNCTRTGLTAGVLFLALAVAVGFGQTLRGLAGDLDRWCRQTIVADFLVRGAMPDASFTLAAALPDGLAEEIAKTPNVARVERLAWVPAVANGREVLVLARTFAPDRPLHLDLQEGDEEAVRRGLSRGDVVLGTGLAAKLGLHAGDTLTLQTAKGARQIHVAGTMTEYAVGGMALYLEWATARRLLDVPGPNLLLVTAGPGAAPALRALCEQRHLLLQSNAELRGLIEQMLARVTGMLWALMALSFVVAALGVVNTLTMNVHDQTREIGVLRALGLRRGQICHVVLTQAFLLGCISILPGAAAGLGLAYVINRSSAAWVGTTVAFHLDGAVLGGCCALAMALALLAALLPARRAARLPVTHSLLPA
jgi:putative ABC transport system permease protein